MSSSEPCSPGGIVADVVESLRAKAEAKQLRIEVELSERYHQPSPPIACGCSRSSSTCWTMRSSSPSAAPSG